MNVQVLRILTTSLLLSTSLVGCASFDFGVGKVKPIEVITKANERTPLNIEQPEPIKTKPIKWVVVTPSNAEEIFQRLEQEGHSPVLFAITDDGYQQLAVTIAELRNIINTQRNIILKYKEYYEPKEESKQSK